MTDLRVKPPYMADGYLEWKLNEVAAIGYALGRSFTEGGSGVIHANEFGQYFAARCGNWAELDRLYNQFRKEAA